MMMRWGGTRSRNETQQWAMTTLGWEKDETFPSPKQTQLLLPLWPTSVGICLLHNCELPVTCTCKAAPKAESGLEMLHGDFNE